MTPAGSLSEAPAGARIGSLKKLPDQSRSAQFRLRSLSDGRQDVSSHLHVPIGGGGVAPTSPREEGKCRPLRLH